LEQSEQALDKEKLLKVNEMRKASLNYLLHSTPNSNPNPNPYFNFLSFLRRGKELKKA
jgi:hypothetical protein